MSALWNALDHREQALLIGSVLVIIVALAIKDVRCGVPSTLKILFTPPLGPLLLVGVIYVAAVVVFAAALGLWMMPFLGLTVTWAIGSAGFMFFTAGDAVPDRQYFAKALGRSIRRTLIIEFLVALYVFGLLVEALLLPVLVVLVSLSAIIEDKPEYAQAKSKLDGVLAVFGLALISHAGWSIATDFGTFWTFENLMRLVLPPAMTIAFLPYAYLLRSYIRWEDRRFHQRWRKGLAPG
jgi:hypothetical protein